MQSVIAVLHPILTIIQPCAEKGAPEILQRAVILPNFIWNNFFEIDPIEAVQQWNIQTTTKECGHQDLNSKRWTV